MADLPNPKSYETIVGEMLSSYMGSIGVNDLNTGSAVTSFFEAMAQAVYRSSGDTFAILRNFSVDRAEGEALQRIALEERIIPQPARVSTGNITITDSSISKISSKIYAGGTPPNIGSVTINISDASEFPASGSIYIGRGTPNIEGPLSYSSAPINQGSYWTITLDSGTSKYHNISESVILAQGGTRTIAAGTVVKTVSSRAASEISFSIVKEAVILDGEVSISNISIVAQQPGADGNVPRNAIKEFSSKPFVGAQVTNPNPLTTGRNIETDEELRIRIKKARLSKGLGTPDAIKSAVLGAQSSDERAIVSSNELVSADNTVLFIDNGEGYEEKTEGVGLEYIISSALGGETHFQLQTAGSQTSVVKAFLQSANSAPFNISANDKLAILVGDVLSEHTFVANDFKSEGAVTAFEIVSSINANSSLLFSARTIENGTKVTISAKEESNEFVQKTLPSSGNDVGDILGLSETEVETLRLYKNGKLLSRNGRTAMIQSAAQQDWSNLITSGDTLILSVDGTNSITYTFTNQDFIDEGTHTTVSSNNTLESWVNVINNKIVGVTASISGDRISLSSNLGANKRSSLIIDPASSLVVDRSMFTSALGLSSTGKESDFSLSRNTAQIKLSQALVAGDSLTAGSELTKAYVSSGSIAGGSVSLSADAELWITIDNKNTSNIVTGVLSGTTLDISKEGSNVIRVKSSESGAFDNASAGNYFILWSSEVAAGNRLEGRIQSVGTDTNQNDYFEFKVTASEYAAASAESGLTYKEGLVIIDSDTPPQKIIIPSGTYNINAIALALSNDIIGGSSFIENEEVINIQTNTLDTSGAIILNTFNAPAKNLNFTAGSSAVTSISHVGFVESSDSENSFPEFIHGSISADADAPVPTSFISSTTTSVDLDAAGISNNLNINMLNPYLSDGTNFIKDAQGRSKHFSIKSISGTTVNVNDNNFIRRLNTGDRFFVSNNYNFDHNDTLTVVLDNDTTEKAFPINLFRRAITNSTAAADKNNFRAYDVESGATTEFSTFFGASFDFTNYKAMMQAKQCLNPNIAVDEDAILFRSVEWGKNGERMNVGYIYPTVPNSPVTSTVTSGTNVEIRIGLKSGAAVANNIDGTTEWNITVTPNTPVAGVEEVTYTHSGTGTAPAMTTLAAGDYVTINNNGDFNEANTGTFRISAASSTSFTIRRTNGEAVVESDIATIATTTISLYSDSDTTAAEIKAHVDSDLDNWITATLLNDNGLSGAGVINLSTHENNDFAAGTESVQLVDGINYIDSSSLSAAAPNAQFVFKNQLALEKFTIAGSGDVYEFRNGEEVRLIPTSIDHINDLVHVLAVTGIDVSGDIKISSNNSKLQISTDVLGSEGAVTISGNKANKSEASIIGVSSIAPNTDMIKVDISTIESDGINADQWVKITNKTSQVKVSGINSTTDVSITQNSPYTGYSTIELENKGVDDRFFGAPRNNIKERGRAFLVEKQGSLTCISWDEVTGASPAFSKTVEFNDAVGGNMSVTFDNEDKHTEFTITSGDRNFQEVQIGDEVTIINFADAANNGTFKVVGVSTDGLTVGVQNTAGVTAASTAVAAGDLIFTTEVKEGDNVEIRAPFNSLNRGIFRVIRRYNNSIYIDNSISVEERVVIVDNLIDAGVQDTALKEETTISVDNTSDSSDGSYFDIDSQSGTTYRIYIDTTGLNLTIPADEGRTLVKADISGGVSNIDVDIRSNITDGSYFDIDSYSGATYRVYYDTTGANATIPAAGGRTLVRADISSGPDTIENVGDLLAAVLDALPEFDCPVTGTGSITCTDITEVNTGDTVENVGDLLAAVLDALPEFDCPATGTGTIVCTDVNTGPVTDAVIGAESMGEDWSITTTVQGADPTSEFDITVNGVTRLTWNTNGGTIDFSSCRAGDIIVISDDFAAANQGEFIVTDVDLTNGAWIEYINSKAVAESTVISDDINVHRSALLFHKYEDTIAGDSFIISNDVLSESNVGSFTVTEKLSNTKIVVQEVLTAQASVNLGNNFTHVYVMEENPYVGYKKIYSKIDNPSNVLQNIVLLDTEEQVNKINELSGSKISAIGKLGFSETISKGIDAYRYHTGLIQQANKILYGDPRDSVTYPGVAAAGVDIFIEPPLVKRIEIAINVRVQTGIAFNRIIEQTRSNIAALINSSPIGQSIAISDIIAIVNSIPGIIAVSISSPQYDPNNDIIAINSSEKPFILDIINDISVQKVD